MSATVNMKRGDTFSRTCTYSRNGALFNLTGTTIRASLRSDSDLLIEELDVTLLAQSGATLGQFKLSKPHAATTLWPVGSHLFDIEYTFPDGSRITTDTISLVVNTDQTR
jgi:hypothetical protein